MTNLRRYFAAALAGAAVLLLLGATTPGLGPETDWIKLFKRSSDTAWHARTNIFKDLAVGATAGYALVLSNATEGSLQFVPFSGGGGAGETNFLADAANIGVSLAGPKRGTTNTVKTLSGSDFSIVDVGGTNLIFSYASGSILDDDISSSGISTRSKLPIQLAYEDEVNRYAQPQYFGHVAPLYATNGFMIPQQAVADALANGWAQPGITNYGRMIQNGDMWFGKDVTGAFLIINNFNSLSVNNAATIILNDGAIVKVGNTAYFTSATDQETNRYFMQGTTFNTSSNVIFRKWEVEAAINSASNALNSLKQDLDAELTAVAGLVGNGIVTKTGGGTMTTRSITGSGDMVVTDGNGVSANPLIGVKTNTATQAGIVESPASVPNVAWATDGNGVPGWRAFASSGEANVGANQGSGTANTYLGKSGVVLNFATLKAEDATMHLFTNSDGTIVFSATNLTGSKIQDGAVTTTKIQDNAVNGAKIQLGSEVNGDLMVYNGTDWVPSGTSKYDLSGQFVKVTTTGAGKGFWMVDGGTNAAIFPTGLVNSNGIVGLWATKDMSSNGWYVTSATGQFQPVTDNRQNFGQRNFAPSNSFSHFVTILKNQYRQTTNAGYSSNLVADMNGPSIYFAMPTNSTTISITNVPDTSATQDYVSMLFCIGQTGVANQVTFNIVGPNQLQPLNSLFMANSAT